MNRRSQTTFLREGRHRRVQEVPGVRVALGSAEVDPTVHASDGVRAGPIPTNRCDELVRCLARTHSVRGAVGPTDEHGSDRSGRIHEFECLRVAVPWSGGTHAGTERY